MAMVDLRNAFQGALGDRGSVRSGTLKYDRAGRGQVVTFSFAKPDGSNEVVTDTIPNNTDLIAAAAKMATDWITANPS